MGKLCGMCELNLNKAVFKIGENSTKKGVTWVRWNHGERFMEKLTLALVFTGRKRKGSV